MKELEVIVWKDEERLEMMETNMNLNEEGWPKY